MTSKTTTVIITALVIMNIGLAIKILTPGEIPINGNNRDDLHRDVSQRFGFDDDQNELFQASVEKHSRAIRETTKKVKDLSVEYYLHQSSGPIKDSLLAAAIAAHQEVYELNNEHFNEVRDICTIEQIAEVENLITGLIGGNKGRRPPGGPPPRHRR